jgi:predicted Ser/Thr protein kinase
MPGDRAEPLRAHDPRTLGTYELIGRLGEGGMGTVYLARTTGGVLVAVKAVRADLAPDDEFRRRFRSEVARARQVPPFCTAEVLDADPDHETPYLVVEYVDGPTLAHVVEQRGPLTAANLHSVAIGVATALTAIHGAGVIHRDLKPRNVLLAPGSPKVIDFGIARAAEATTGITGLDQMVGTVAYMAPERFAEAGVPLTPAADVFAWGGVVAYAGTGRTPFAADSPPATAARILTQPPDLDGLTGRLRDLVAQALAKEPADRPSARELLDLLVAGPSRPAATAAALAGQPDLRAAAAEAQAVTGVKVPAAAVPATAGRVGYAEDSIVTLPIPISPMSMSMAGPPPREPGRRWFLPFAVALLVLAAAAGALMTVVSGGGPPGDPADAMTPIATSAGPSVGPAGAVPATVPSTGASASAEQLLITDALSRPRLWQASDQENEGACAFEDGALVARRAEKGLYKCNGPLDELPTDIRVAVDVRLLSRDSCAGLWFRFSPWKGYQLRICENTIFFGTHKSKENVTTIHTIHTFPLDQPLPVGGGPSTIELRAVGDTVEINIDDVAVGTAALTDGEITDGRVILGVTTERGVPQDGPYEVAFSNMRIWGLPG